MREFICFDFEAKYFVTKKKGSFLLFRGEVFRWTFWPIKMH